MNRRIEFFGYGLLVFAFVAGVYTFGFTNFKLDCENIASEMGLELTGVSPLGECYMREVVLSEWPVNNWSNTSSSFSVNRTLVSLVV